MHVRADFLGCGCTSYPAIRLRRYAGTRRYRGQRHVSGCNLFLWDDPVPLDPRRANRRSACLCISRGLRMVSLLGALPVVCGMLVQTPQAADPI
jgi:hypothetical protein